MKTFGEAKWKEHSRPGWSAHALGIEIGNANNFQRQPARNYGIGSTCETLVCGRGGVILPRRRRRRLRRLTLSIAHGQFLAQKWSGQFLHIGFVKTGLRHLSKQFFGK